MSASKRNTAATSKPAAPEPWRDPDDAPELDDDFFERAEIRDGGALIKEGKPAIGRPPTEQPKQPVSLRLDADVIAHFKGGGPGWQTRINEVLRKSLRRKAGAKAKA